MKHHLRLAAYLVVALWISPASAGAYEDYFQAIKRDDAAGITRLLQRGFDPNTPSPDGQPGLLLALRESSLKAARAILAAPDLKVESRNAQDESPLMMAALRGDAALVRDLIARGADVNKPGWAPLHYAATGGHLEVMQILLDNYAFIDAESPNGTTPLMMAAMYGSTEAVKLLLDAGADTAMKNKLGLTAMDFAQRGSRPDAAELIALQVRSQRPKGKW